MEEELSVDCPSDEPEFLSQARMRSVLVETDHNFGGGVIFATNLVITTRHFLENQGNITVNGRAAKVIHDSKALDLAALEVPTRNLGRLRYHSCPKLRDAAVLFTPVETPKRVKARFVFMAVEGKLGFVSDDLVCSDGLTEIGTCGAGVWGVNGLIGISDTDENLAYVRAKPQSILEEFMGEVEEAIRTGKPRYAVIGRTGPEQDELPFFHGPRVEGYFRRRPSRRQRRRDMHVALKLPFAAHEAETICEDNALVAEPPDAR